MAHIRLKTNINCGSCIKAVTPFLDRDDRINSWKVDTDSPEKILTVEGDISAEEVAGLVTAAGFQAGPE